VILFKVVGVIGVSEYELWMRLS